MKGIIIMKGMMISPHLDSEAHCLILGWQTWGWLWATNTLCLSGHEYYSVHNMNWIWQPGSEDCAKCLWVAVVARTALFPFIRSLFRPSAWYIWTASTTVAERHSWTDPRHLWRLYQPGPLPSPRLHQILIACFHFWTKLHFTPSRHFSRCESFHLSS